MNRYVLGAAGTDSPCQVCGTVEVPRAWFHAVGIGPAELAICVRCLAGAVDAVTGWSFRNNVEVCLQAAAVKRARLAARVPKKRGRPFKKDRP